MDDNGRIGDMEEGKERDGGEEKKEKKIEG